MGVLLIMRNQELLRTVDMEVSEQALVIGRSPQASIRLDHASVSRKHLIVMRRGEVIGVKDMGATNGVYVNGQRLEGAARLANGDSVCVGVYTLIYQNTPPADWLNPGDTAILSVPEQQALGLAKVAPPPPKPAPSLAVVAPPAPAAVEVREIPRAAPLPAAAEPPPPEASESDELADNDSDFGEETLVMNEPGDSAAANVAVGEFEASEEDEALEVRPSSEDLTPMSQISPHLRQLMEKRLAIFEALEKLDERRQKILRQPDYPKEAENEVRRQMREAPSPLSAEMARERLTKLDGRLKKLAELEKRRAAGEALNVEALPKEFDELWTLARKQWQLFIERDELVPALLSAGYAEAAEEPLRLLLEKYGVNGKSLFGRVWYTLALEAESYALNNERREIRKTLLAREKDGAAKKGGGMFGFLGRGKDSPETQEALRLQERDIFCAQQAGRILREQQSLEKQLLQDFWQIYNELAVRLVESRFASADEVLARAYLRYGLLGVKPYLLAPEVLQYILKDCANPVREWDDSQYATHVLYADEYICLVAAGALTPSIDEDLELNHAQTPRWKAEKAWRRQIYSRIRRTALLECVVDLEKRIVEQRALNDSASKERAKLIKNAADYRKRNADLGQQVQSSRVEAARLERICARINENYLPALADAVRENAERLAATGVGISPRDLASLEARSIWRVSRLTANLHETFPPFSLRARFRLDNGSVNDRQTVLEMFKQVEASDPLIFQDTLVTAKRRTQRVYLRFCPYILLTPGCGYLGYSWNPRAGTEVGRLVFPLYCPRLGMRERILHPLAADFRFDTSKSLAGVDLLTSDTLAAAYATVRWDYRKRSKENREKAAIYTEETDRKNWRRHYSLYLQSSGESGKKLFYKCLEVYDAVLRYLDLPEGMERLRR